MHRAGLWHPGKRGDSKLSACCQLPDSSGCDHRGADGCCSHDGRISLEEETAGGHPVPENLRGSSRHGGGRILSPATCFITWVCNLCEGQLLLDYSTIQTMFEEWRLHLVLPWTEFIKHSDFKVWSKYTWGVKKDWFFHPSIQISIFSAEHFKVFQLNSSLSVCLRRLIRVTWETRTDLFGRCWYADETPV